MNCRAVIAGGLAAGLALLLAGCGAASVPKLNGPFGKDSPGGDCMPVPRGEVATVASQEWPNSGGTARIEKIILVGSHDLRLVAAWVVPVTGTDLIGVFAGYPPLGTKGDGPGSLAPGIEWADRQRADGAVIPHTAGHNVFNLVLVVRPSGVLGSVKDIYVDYAVGSTHYRLDLHFFLKVFNGVPTGSSCSSP